MGASISRLQRAGGNRQAAIQGLLNDPSPVVAAAKAKYANDPAGLAAWEDSKINQTTKGKYSGVLGKAIQGISKIAPYALPFVPGLGPLAVGALSAGAGLAGGKNLSQSLTQGALSYGGAKLLGGGALSKAKGMVAGPAAATAATPGAGGFLSNVGNSLVSSITKDPLKAAQYGLAGYSALQGAKAQSRSNSTLDRALGSLGSESTLRPEDLSGIYGDPGNPYAVSGKPNSALSAARRALGGG